MRHWTTTIQAIDPLDGEIKTWGGPNVPGINWQDAKDYLQRNGLGYCDIDGELVEEIPTKSDEQTPNWKEAVDYSTIFKN